jgi:large subunit ribosomal protein L13
MTGRPRRADIFTMKTYSPKPEHIERRWYVIDASEQVLGRVASEAAVILRGKHKPIYARHMDVGDHLIIVNAAKVVLTGGKETKKVAYRHSGHPGGITGTVYERLLATKPAFAVEKAVRGMLPKNRLGRAMLKKLHVEAGAEHRHQAQKPVGWTIGMRPAWDGLPVPAEATGNGAPRPSKPETALEEPETSTAPKKATSRKTAARKTAGRKTTDGKTTARKTTTRKPAAATRKKTATTTRKSATRKPAATKKTTAKTAARKSTTRKKKES